jgi:hypothetical protein
MVHTPRPVKHLEEVRWLAAEQGREIPFYWDLLNSAFHVLTYIKSDCII